MQCTQTFVISHPQKKSYDVRRSVRQKGLLVKIRRFGCICILSFILGFLFFQTDSEVSAAVLSVPEFKSIEEGFAQSPQAPFIVRDCKEFSERDVERALTRLKNSDEIVFGYDSQGQVVENLKVGHLIKAWENEELKIKILDSLLHIIDLPNVLIQNHSRIESIDADREPLGQTIILSPSKGYTALHMDPPSYGGGWMYLVQGQKDWQFLSPQWLNHLFTGIEKELPDVSSEALPQADFYAVHAVENSFVYFPPGWMHRVWTYDKAIGIGGYIRPESTVQSAEEIDGFLRSFGRSAIWKMP